MRKALNADPRCVAEARRLTISTLAGWGLPDLTDVAALLVSELATNAILHARSGVVLTLENAAAEVRVHVCDESPAVPRVRHFSADSGTGRGVRLLESLSNAWGIELRERGKCVWFTLSVSPVPSADAWEFDFDAVEPL